LPDHGDKSDAAPKKTLAEIEREAIEQALVFHDGKVAPAAAQLGISKSTLYAKIREYDLER
jgi:DNA-binding NtrC family response regulator